MRQQERIAQEESIARQKRLAFIVTVSGNGMAEEMQTLIETHASLDKLFGITAKIACCTDAQFAIDFVCRAFGTQCWPSYGYLNLYMDRSLPPPLQTFERAIAAAVSAFKDELLIRFANAYVANNPVANGTQNVRADIERATVPTSEQPYSDCVGQSGSGVGVMECIAVGPTIDCSTDRE